MAPVVVPEKKETSMEIVGDGTASSSTASHSMENDKAAAADSCSTPKARRFRIPELLSCPPAPKKRRVAPKCSSSRSPIAFFAPPDLEIFFLFALRNTPASLT
ncbi:hypothetical protein FEM48_Zijuj12G0093600 [Ziziphus jujuba var. spinosa]|uniref:Uncharacterized protein n=1 Tax=Ziziphus jujuba var. spinosa TaxID=714518 RepID=A0A978UCH2_ZIZJJ|nr:hypothetical protein FEM48_Zijuj12G0093600 [Ziziphus jujuba var. spinosa]